MHVLKIMLNQTTISDMITEKTNAYCHGVNLCVRRLFGHKHSYFRLRARIYRRLLVAHLGSHSY